MTPTTITRIASIDVFRAVTMLMMIFVNDLWTLTGIPHWLEHTQTYTDGMGFADIVFPAFLVVMGMSIPLAIQNRVSRNQSKMQILKHIVARSFALVVMGVFTVNTPYLDSAATGINNSWFEIIVVACFFLIWNVYPKEKSYRKYFYLGLQVAGAITLLVFATLYRGQGESEGEIVIMQPRWWGILGLIGWAYLGSAILYLYLRHSLLLLFVAWLFFTSFNIAGHAHLFGEGEVFVGNGAFHAFTFIGILATVFLQNLKAKGSSAKFIPTVLIAAAILVITGFIMRNFFIISKNLATPPWVFICSGISLVLFTIIYILTDLKGKENWFSFIKAAGTSTLTCYLIPYFYYNIVEIYQLQFPGWLKFGVTGLIKSLAFALVIIAITSLLGKLKIKLKI